MTITSTIDPHPNFAISLVATAPSPATTGTSLVVTSGDGSRFPDPSTEGPFNIAIHPIGELPTPDNAEICRVTARNSDTLTITRQQEGTSARAVTVGDVVYAAITKKTLMDAEQAFPVSDIDWTLTSTWNWVMPGWGWQVGATPTWGAGILSYTPIFCGRPMEFDQIGIRVVSGAAGDARLGIYSATVNSTQNRISIGSLVVDAGTVSTTASGSKTITLSPSVTIHGYAYLAIVCDAAPVVQCPDDGLYTFVTGGNNDVVGSFDHNVPIASGQSALVAGGLPSTPVTPTATATAYGRAPVRLRMVT